MGSGELNSSEYHSVIGIGTHPSHNEAWPRPAAIPDPCHLTTQVKLAGEFEYQAQEHQGRTQQLVRSAVSRYPRTAHEQINMRGFSVIENRTG